MEPASANQTQLPASPGPFGALSRRDVITTALAAGPTAALASLAAAQDRPAEPWPQPSALRGSPTVYNMKKSINQWAFPYLERMTLEECLLLAKRAGFDGIELNYDLDNDLSPKSGSKEYRSIRRMAEANGIQISGLCSFLFWPYPLTSNDPAHPLANRPRARAQRCLRPARPRSHWLASETSRKTLRVLVDRDVAGVEVYADVFALEERVAQHRKHLLQRLPDDANGDE